MKEILHTTLRKTTLKLNPEQEEFILTCLKKSGTVRILKLGTFRVKRFPARKVNDHFNGKTVKIKARNRVVFSPFSSLGGVVK